MSPELSLEQEQQLLERITRGDGEAFGLLYDAFKNALYRTVIYPKVRDAGAAEEILQETFLLALKKLDSFEFRDRSIFFWLRMIAINKTREFISSSSRHSTVDEVVFDFFHDDSFQPESQVVLEDYQSILRERIIDTLSEMNERYREAIQLRLLEKKSREESAAQLDISIETFDVVFFRACKSFKKQYMNKYGEI
ncbi:MAG TPA: RNA polymerase sigma factor [bacterium]|nr:RNA polymerase sigma factor [bacterium]